MPPQKKQVRRWCFTSYLDKLEFKEGYDYIIAQREKCPTTGKLHYQGYIVCKQKIVMKTVKQILNDEKVHLEPAAGNHAQCIAYCSKKESQYEEPVEWGDRNCIKQGKRNDLNSIIDYIKKKR